MMEDSNKFMDKFFEENPIPQDTLDHFSSIPWTQKILSDPAYKPVPTYSRSVKSNGEDYFFGQTVNTTDTIHHYLTLQLRDYQPLPLTKPSPPTSSSVPAHKQATIVPEKPDCLFLIRFGNRGIDGHPNVLHGGMACAILDETIGLMVMLHHNQVADEGPRDLLFTVNLNMNFRRQVSTPGEVLVRTWLAKRERRKWYAKGQIVDKDGNVLTEADGLWLVAGANKL